MKNKQELAQSLSEHLDRVDESLLQQAHQIDTAEKFHALDGKRKRIRHTFAWSGVALGRAVALAASFAVALTIAFGGITLVNYLAATIAPHPTTPPTTQPTDPTKPTTPPEPTIPDEPPEEIPAPDAELYSGSCGENASWLLNADTGTFTITGTGPTDELFHFPDWYDMRHLIRQVIIRPGITALGMNAFQECENLSSVYFPDSLTSIGSSAFYNCPSLTSVILPPGITTIENSTFSWCTSLTYVSIPDSVTRIDSYAFNHCHSLTSISLPTNLIVIGSGAFNESGLTQIEIPVSLQYVEMDAFTQCTSLRSVYISDLDAWATLEFFNTEANPLHNGADLYIQGQLATDITISDAYFATFTGCRSLRSVTFTEGAGGGIGSYAFQNCTNLTSVICGENMTVIAHSAFEGCKQLTHITLPRSLTEIRQDAFSGCTALTDAHYGGSNAGRKDIYIQSGNQLLEECTWSYGIVPTIQDYQHWVWIITLALVAGFVCYILMRRGHL